MARGLSEEAVRARPLTAYKDLPRALARLGLRDTSDVALFLIERNGRVWWRAWGGHDPQGEDALARVLANRPAASDVSRNRQDEAERRRTL